MEGKIAFQCAYVVFFVYLAKTELGIHRSIDMEHLA